MKIVAIGGGEIGRPGTSIQTESIDRRIIELSGVDSSKVLFLPTASGDSESYAQVVKDYYGGKLGCKIDVLYLISNTPSLEEMRARVFSSDIIYVGGGNTLKMLKVWRKTGLDKILLEAAEKNIVLSGISAGAICWFKYGNSDSLKFSDARNPLIKVRGLDILSSMACPHYDVEKVRRPSLHSMIQKNGGICLAMDNCSAVEFIDGNYRLLTSTDGANAYKVFKQGGAVVEVPLLKDAVYRPVSELFTK